MTEERFFNFIVDEEDSGERIDAFLSEQIPELSRSRIQKAVRALDCSINGEAVSKSSRKVHEGEQIILRFSPPEPIDVQAENIPIDIIFEDENLVVVNKRAGMVVHPAPGNESGTLVNALLAHCNDLSGIGGSVRPGIVHRLDAGTSGLLVVAKNDAAHIALSRQLMEQRVGRVYFAVVWGEMPAPQGEIDLPIGRSPRDRKKMAVVPTGGKEAITSYYVLDTISPFQYIRLKLGTGRTHQIRVHLSHNSHPILGDPVYGGRKIRKGTLSKNEAETAGKALSMIDRQALHAGELSFVHPATGDAMMFRARFPSDIHAVLELLGIKHLTENE